jgi:hypothetical protein
MFLNHVLIKNTISTRSLQIQHKKCCKDKNQGYSTDHNSTFLGVKGNKMPAAITPLFIPADGRPAGFAAKRLHLHAKAPPFINIEL